MDRVFSRGEDPYGYGSLPYEKGRLDAMAAAVGGRRRAFALELGCAEGIFTRRLADLAERVVGVDISPVALGRARARLEGLRGVALVEADLRAWEGPGSGACDLIVVGDVLYYLDKPLVQPQFEEAFGRIAGWLAPGGLLLLAHGFAGPEQRIRRQGYRERFERLGLRLLGEEAAGDPAASGGVQCLLSRLER